MQTFLPYASFPRCARVLDYRRLGKQRVEAKQILQILLGETTSTAWRNHPAVRMWAGYESSLAWYGQHMCEEWIRRGYKDTLLSYFVARHEHDGLVRNIPPFIMSTKFRNSHRSNLLRKDKNYYSKYFKNVPDNLPYIWPTKEVING